MTPLTKSPHADLGITATARTETRMKRILIRTRVGKKAKFQIRPHNKQNAAWIYATQGTQN